MSEKHTIVTLEYTLNNEVKKVTFIDYDSYKGLISEFVEDLKKINKMGNEHHKEEHYYGTIVNNIISHFIWKWEARKKQ